MSRRARLGFLAACLLVFALVAAVITWGPPSNRAVEQGAADRHPGPGGDPAGRLGCHRPARPRAAASAVQRRPGDAGLVLALAPT